MLVGVKELGEVVIGILHILRPGRLPDAEKDIGVPACPPPKLLHLEGDLFDKAPVLFLVGLLLRDHRFGGDSAARIPGPGRVFPRFLIFIIEVYLLPAR